MLPFELLLITLINAVFFFVLTLRNIFKPSKEQFIKIYVAEITVTALVFLQYFLTFILDNSNVMKKDYELFTHQLKYVVWIITLPLILYTYWKLANINGYSTSFDGFLWATIIMVIFMILGEFFNKNLLVISLIAFGVIVFLVGEIMVYLRDKNLYGIANLGWFFVIGWWLYVLGFFFTGYVRYFIFGMADFINKGLFTVALNSYI